MTAARLVLGTQVPWRKKQEEGRGGEGVGGEANGRSTGRKGGCRRKQEPTGGFDTVLKASDLHFLRPLWACGQ